MSILHLDALGSKLYVGRSGQGRRRTAEHRATSSWWPRIATTVWVHTSDPADPWLTESMESLLIHYYAPTYNQRRETGDHLAAAMHLIKTFQIYRLPNTETLMTWLERKPRYQEYLANVDAEWDRIRGIVPS